MVERIGERGCKTEGKNDEKIFGEKNYSDKRRICGSLKQGKGDEKKSKEESSEGNGRRNDGRSKREKNQIGENIQRTEEKEYNINNEKGEVLNKPEDINKRWTIYFRERLRAA